MKRFLKDHQGWICSALTIIGVGLLNLFDGRYVSQKQYTEDQKTTTETLRRIDDTISRNDKSIALLQQNRQTLDDHENRLRAVERKQQNL